MKRICKEWNPKTGEWENRTLTPAELASIASQRSSKFLANGTPRRISTLIRKQRSIERRKRKSLQPA